MKPSVVSRLVVVVLMGLALVAGLSLISAASPLNAPAQAAPLPDTAAGLAVVETRPTPVNTPVPGPTPSPVPASRQFVRRSGTTLLLEGRPFRFGGANNYYLMYKSQAMVDDVLRSAAVQNFKVLRTWGWLDIGYPDEPGAADGVYFQYFDGLAPIANDGADGLQHLDYVIYRAGQLGLRLIIPFTGNWDAFGGIDQYVRWRGGQYHDEFYTDPTIRQWYKNYVAHLLNRVNTYNGIAYKNDPTIMAWELANEPRCKGSGAFPASAGCTTATLTNWASEMSAFIKSVDPNHLVAVGDEGFFCKTGAADWTRNCTTGEGVDTVALTSLSTIDYMSFHLYPQEWGFGAEANDWGVAWVNEHVDEAQALGKPAVMGEYGYQDASADQATRRAAYRAWTDALLARGGNGDLVWMLAGYQDDSTRYPDADGYTIYCPSPVCSPLYAHASQMAGISLLLLASFETDTQGFVPAAWDPHGSVAQSTTAPTHLSHSLQITSTDTGGWFGVDLPLTLDLSRATRFKFDVTAGAAGSLKNVAVKTGESMEWCELPVATDLTVVNTTRTVVIDLLQDFKCGETLKKLALNQVRGFYLFFEPGSYYLDFLRVEAPPAATRSTYLPVILKPAAH